MTPPEVYQDVRGRFYKLLVDGLQLPNLFRLQERIEQGLLDDIARCLDDASFHAWVPVKEQAIGELEP